MNLPRAGTPARDILDDVLAGERVLWRHVPAHLKVRLWAWTENAALDRQWVRLSKDAVFRIERSRQRRG